MRAEIHGPDGRHIVLDVKGADLGALVDHAERLYRLTDGPVVQVKAAGFAIERKAPSADGIDGQAQP